MKTTDAKIENVITTLSNNFNKELFEKTQENLNDYWFWEWDDSISSVSNLYHFYDALKLYGGFCRRWEEHHNGNECVVERVRDKYLIPKIKELVNYI